MKYSQTIIDICKNNGNIKISKNIKNKNLLYQETFFLPIETPISIRAWYVNNNRTTIVKCPVCNIKDSKPNIRKPGIICTCSRKCAFDKIDSTTGLTVSQSKSIKQSKTLKNIDPESGKSIASTRALKGAQTVKTKIDPLTNNTILDKMNMSRSKTYNIIDEKSGLNIYEQNSIKRHNKLSKTDDISGLNGYDLMSIKTKETRSKVNKDTGLNGYQEAGIKVSETLKTINEESGISRAHEIVLKGKETLSKIDSISGLTGYQKLGIKVSETLKTINEESGISRAHEISIKTKETLSKIDSISGLTGYQKLGIKTGISLKSITYDNRVNNFPKDYTLLTSKNDYTSGNILLKYSCNKCNLIRESYWPYIRCTTCYPYNKSIAENEVLEYCQSLSSNVLSNTRSIIKPLELDIHLPNHNLAIEYDGLFWHSSYSTDSENKDYHLNKTELCQEQGIQLFHIFENEWIDPVKQSIWKSIIKNKLGKSSRIYARKTKVAQITSKDKKQFLIDNHLQGDCASSVNLGLYLDDELVSVMTFGKSRYNKKVDWELLRFCNRLETSVVGGASKLLAAFRRENVGSIISYADKRRSTGGLYEALGFEMSHESPPNYFYFRGSMELESRIKYQKHKLEKMLDIFNIELTETENMYANGYRKIYDCGNQVWKIL